MTLFAFKNLGCDIIWGTTNRPFSLSVKFELGCETKISNFDFHLVVEEKISKLEISMDDSMRVKVFYGITNLNDIALDFQFVKSLSSPKEFVKRLTLTELKNNVYIFGILEEMLETNDVGMVK